VGAIAAMFACNIWPLQTFFPLLLGTIIEPLGITILAVAINNGHQPLVYGMLALTGVGTGIRFMPGASFTLLFLTLLLLPLPHFISKLTATLSQEHPTA